jgi:hypothetical protein
MPGFALAKHRQNMEANFRLLMYKATPDLDWPDNRSRQWKRREARVLAKQLQSAAHKEVIAHRRQTDATRTQVQG